ncbi:MAG TPA: OsmC family protein [Thermoplasmata archaeon]|nr:OsmC family protein [Thermoplasmata archaeon]
MGTATAPQFEEFPRAKAQVDQIEGYRFQVTYPGTTVPSLVVDEGPPLSQGKGPDPVLMLAAAVGHCLSATLVNTLERARVPATPIRTTVEVVLGRNERKRKRVRSMEVHIECAPLKEEDRPRFERSIEVFEDYCTVTGAVREGIPVQTLVAPPAAVGNPARAR